MDNIVERVKKIVAEQLGVNRSGHQERVLLCGRSGR